MSDVHHFKGIVNAGVLSWIAGSATAATLAQIAGVYVFRLDDLPIFEQFAEGFEFVRINRCRMEFMPRYNMSNLPIGAVSTTDTVTASGQLPTFITGYDEVPLVVGSGVGGDLATSGTWSSQTGDDANVAEMKAYGCQGGITPSYIRGLQRSKETEIYKKHSVSFIPAFYDYAMTNATGEGNVTNGYGTYERRTKKWINCNVQLQTVSGASSTPVSTATPAIGPDFYGPVYSFSQPGTNTSTTSIVQLYDVKLHYSVSFRRVRGL